MSSIYQRVLGDDFRRLHPQIQRRFGFSSADGIASIGTGVMDEVWKGRFYTEPFLRIGASAASCFLKRDETSRSESRTTPSSIDSAERRFVDSNVRIAAHPPVRCVHGLQRGARPHRRLSGIAPASGRRHRRVGRWSRGARVRSGAQRFYEGVIGFSFPMLFSGIADVREWYDDTAQCFRIVVDVHNRVWGPLFGYRGSFDVEWKAIANVPRHVLPVRQERRD